MYWHHFLIYFFNHQTPNPAIIKLKRKGKSLLGEVQTSLYNPLVKVVGTLWLFSVRQNPFVAQTKDGTVCYDTEKTMTVALRRISMYLYIFFYLCWIIFIVNSKMRWLTLKIKCKTIQKFCNKIKYFIKW